MIAGLTIFAIGIGTVSLLAGTSWTIFSSVLTALGGALFGASFRWGARP